MPAFRHTIVFDDSLNMLWKGYPPDTATWEHHSNIHDDFIDEYEAAVEAEAQLEAEEAELEAAEAAAEAAEAAAEVLQA